MLKIRFVKAGLASSIQDGARNGMAFYGVPVSGFMDQHSGKFANLLVGNPLDNPCVEMSYTAAEIYFDADAKIAVTGADMQFKINNSPIPLNQTLHLQKGDVFGGSSAKKGVRSYLAIAGKWQTTMHFGSSATYTLAKMGAMEGALVGKGDCISISSRSQDNVDQIYLPQNQVPFGGSLKIIDGPEFHLLNQKIRNIEFTVGTQSNRMAALLEGPAIDIEMPHHFKSCVVFPGIIQCTPAGKLIVVLQDGQTTGGYPRVGIIESQLLDQFNQLRIGTKLQFE